MTSTPAGEGRGIHVSGHATFNGTAQTGDHSSAEFISRSPGTGDSGESEQVALLRQAVEELRLRVRALDPGELPSGAGDAAETALAQVEDAPAPADEAGQGPVRSAIFTLSGALASVASLSDSLRALREAAAPWF
ncbi:DUF5955 family protein [Streptomyces sp. NPDC058330]|uniref:DUF5955 family protein n=1 Tax=Streptomyces sp. NPDC058330 TaxID=3346449 RepID=UPI0036EEDDED